MEIATLRDVQELKDFSNVKASRSDRNLDYFRKEVYSRYGQDFIDILNNML